MKNQAISYKTFFLNYFLFIVFTGIIFLVLIYSVRLTQKNWNKNLQSVVQDVLDEKENDTWVIEGDCPINNPLSLSAACYDVRNKKNGEYYKAIIIRLQTFYGPIPGVFIMDKNKKVEYKGYALLHGRIANQLTNFPNSRRVNYWSDRIPQIIE